MSRGSRVRSPPGAFLVNFLQKKKKLLVGESNPGRLRDRQKCYQLHQPGCWMTIGFLSSIDMFLKKKFFLLTVF